MKKNFMAIASLLIAAMLLVVSCAPEANVEGKVEDGLVHASLMATAAGKALTVKYPENEKLSYTVTLAAGWNADNNYKMDEVVGAKTITNADISKKIELGWISQGLWTVTVEGKRGSDVVVTGSTTKYITKGNEGIVVFLKTDTTYSKTTAIDFDITVNELAATNSGYDLKATIERADKATGTPEITDPSFTSTPVKGTNGKNNNTRKYISNNTTLTPGYYKVTVQLIKTTPAATGEGQGTEEVIGGITRGVLVTGESKITIKGSVSASDFAKGSLNVYTPEVEIDSFTAVTDASESDNILGTDVDDSTNTYKGNVTLATFGDNDSYTITYTVGSHCTPTNQNGVTFSDPTYTWTVDGETPTEEKASITNNSITVNYTAPGHKNVTCLVTYLCTVRIGETNYQFTIGNEAVASVLVKGPAVEGEVTGEATTQTQSN